MRARMLGGCTPRRASYTHRGTPGNTQDHTWKQVALASAVDRWHLHMSSADGDSSAQEDYIRDSWAGHPGEDTNTNESKSQTHGPVAFNDKGERENTNPDLVVLHSVHAPDGKNKIIHDLMIL